MNKLYNDDCLKVMDELIKQGVKVDSVLTSPPYNRKRNDKYNNYDDNNCNYNELLINSVNKMLDLTEKYVFLNIQKNYYNKKRSL